MARCRPQRKLTAPFPPCLSNGQGDPPTPSKGDLESGIKNIGFFDISGATNIANTKYDSPANPVAPSGVLVGDVTPAIWQEFLSIIDDAELAKAGLHNGRPQYNDIDGKYESIALASVMDPAFPDDYFVFTLADNDFITANGIQDGVAYADPYATGTGFDVRKCHTPHVVERKGPAIATVQTGFWLTLLRRPSKSIPCLPSHSTWSKLALVHQQARPDSFCPG